MKVNVGIGTKIARAIKRLGIEPCASCSKRVDAINKKEEKLKALIKNGLRK